MKWKILNLLNIKHITGDFYADELVRSQIDCRLLSEPKLNYEDCQHLKPPRLAVYLLKVLINHSSAGVDADGAQLSE